MTGYDFGLDIEAELAGMRGRNNRQQKPDRPKSQEVPAQPVPPEIQAKHGEGSSAGGQAPEAVQRSKQQEPTLSHSHGGEGASTSVKTPERKTGAPSLVDWKRFKTMPGIFEHVGGDRPVRLNPNIKRSQVSGLLEPMLHAVQKHLREKHTGAVVTFPWGEYEITEKNRVFTTKSSLMRYQTFDALRDAAGTHVQYAKQWMVLQHPVFEPEFNPETHLGPNNDELDIYALLFVAHTSEEYAEPSFALSGSEQDFQTVEQLEMVNRGMGRMLEKLNEQEKMFREYAERNAVMQTVILLDRMGLLNGGLPRDVGEFVRVLEENRDAVAQTDATVVNHIHAEKERKRAIARQERLRQMQQRKG